MNQDPTPIWSGIQVALRRAVPGAMYDIWLAPLTPVELAGSPPVLTVTAPAEIRAWVAERYGPALARAARDAGFPDVTVTVVGPTAGRGSAAPRAPAAASPAAAPGPATTALNPKFTFGQFVIGDANRFAHAAALAVAELPGQAYNPLFIYGPPGVGKTHLLHSIGNYVNAYGSGLTVRYTTAETFTNQFVSALRRGDVGSFKGRYRRNDVLLIDDVQFLAAKAKTEEEFFHTFNALHDAGAQLVLTSDRLPRDLNALEDRLRERFEAGLVTAIAPPDLRTRLAVLRKRAQHDGVQLAESGVLEVLAARVPHNIRALEGALIRVVAFSSLAGRALTVALAEEVLADLYPPSRTVGAAGGRATRPTIEEVQQLTAEAFGLTREELLSANRSPRLAWPRQVAMYLAREHTGETLPSIGAGFGGRNHTTVLHACRRATERLASDPDAFTIVRRLTEQLGGGPGPSGAADRLR
ncbi:MAG: chromosomal replication initiator protein DnaA [Solirubrobacteraceae bacterium]